MKTTFSFGASIICLLFSYEIAVAQASGTKLQFDGTNDCVEVPNAAVLNFSGDFTVEVWVRSSTLSGAYHFILEKGNSGSSYPNYQLRLVNNAFSFCSDHSTTPSNALASWTISANTWYHVVGVRESGVARLYVNGVLAGTGINQGAIDLSNGYALTIGAQRIFGTQFQNYWQGDIDEVRIWSYARSVDSIRSGMHRRMTGSETGLAGCWRFDENSGTTAYDLTSNHTNGTLTNGPTWASSTAPFADGTSAGAAGFTSGTANLGTVSLTTTDDFDAAVDLTVTRLDSGPNQLPTGSTTVLDDRYWVVNCFGSPGTFAANLTFTVPASFTNNGLAAASQYTLYKRESTGDGTWQTAVSGASGLTSTTVTFNGLASFSQFAIGTNDPLPAELTEFTAVCRASDAVLQWRTETETECYGFEIERRQVDEPRKDRMLPVWSVVGFVKGSGTSNTAHTYSFTDTKVATGRWAYRLKQQNNDGTCSYSQNMELDIALPTECALEQNYPNPFNPGTSIRFALPEDCTVRLVIFNVVGQEVARPFDGELAAGYHTVRVNASALSAGTYFYRLETGKFTSVRKMIVLK